MIKLIRQAEKDGGILYNPVTKEVNPSIGYAVNVVKKRADNPNEIFDFFNNHIENKGALFIWVKKDYDGNWSGGFAKHSEDVKDVVILGMLNGEQTIWDCAKKVSIKIPEGQRAGTLSQQNTYAKMRAEKFAMQLPPQ